VPITLKENGIEYLYASLNKHPDVGKMMSHQSSGIPWVPYKNYSFLNEILTMLSYNSAIIAVRGI